MPTDHPAILQNEAAQNNKPRLFEGASFGFYAFFLGIVSWRHAMSSEESQAWIIARDSTSIPNLFHNLRYEGHPALWHLILYLPSHLSWNPISMQFINYLFALIEAWLIISYRKLHWTLRVLFIFSFYLFLHYGTASRNYMLATLLLTAAMRCLLANIPRRGWALLFLVLAIQTHIFAIPIVAIIAVWAYITSKVDTQNPLRKVLSGAQFWLALIILLSSVAAAYLTVRPPADSRVPSYGLEHHSVAYNFLLAEGKAWDAFTPIPESSLPPRVAALLVPHFQIAVLGSIYTILLYALVIAVFRTARARWFFLAAAGLQMIAMAITVHAAPIHHYGLILVSFMLALMLDASALPSERTHQLLPIWAASAIIFGILAYQNLANIYAVISGIHNPYCQGLAASDWLKQNHLDKNPLVIEPDMIGMTILAYLERPSAYSPTCNCVGSFTLWNSARNLNAETTPDILNQISRNALLPVILLTNHELDASKLRERNIVKLPFAAPRSTMREDYYIYEYAPDKNH